MGIEAAAARRHLDLGCGSRARNPYGCAELFGVDLLPDPASAPAGVQLVAANLALEPIPFPAQHFDSVSAYDFLEHVPRVGLDYSAARTRFPFIELMNEVWRVLKPGGLFYAVMPAYGHELAFADPTHVNVLSAKSQRYFTGTEPMGRMYGFHGRFELVRQQRLHPRGDYEAQRATLERRLKRLVDALMRRRSHLLWELRALKP